MCSCSCGSHRPANHITSLILIILSLFLTIVSGCGTLSNGRGWGQDATLSPGWDRIKEAAINASLSPETWAPIAAALALQVDDMDKRISDWASMHTPIFGSQKDADKWSSYLNDTLEKAYLLTSIVTPSGNEPSQWFESKLKGLATGVAAYGITSATTRFLKERTDRTRPDKSNNRSLPSGHASTSGAFNTLARQNIQALSLSENSKTFANIGLVSIAAGAAWARVEAKRHYPSDVLAGYALGHFLSAFINDAFLGLDIKREVFINIEPSKDSIMASLHWSY